MPCYHPLQAHQGEPKSNGKASINFSPQPNTTLIELPCGQCIGCRLERSRQWALRCMHESQLYEQNCFVTLTYSDENLPKYNSLKKSDFQKFMKRLRKRIEPAKVRFYMCGEYGDENGRPHYHACLFNYDFPDKTLWKTQNDVKLYRSELLEKLWPFGHCSVGDVTFESAAYVARYVMKKVTGKNSKAHYERLDTTTGEIIDLLPEYTDMSRRPGIGKQWYDKYKNDLRKDFITSRGIKMKPPKYYDRLLELEDPHRLKLLKKERLRKAQPINEDNLKFGRLSVKEKIKAKRTQTLIRDL